MIQGQRKEQGGTQDYKIETKPDIVIEARHEQGRERYMSTNKDIRI